MPIRVFTLAIGENEADWFKVHVDLQTRQNWYKIGPGHMKYAYPAVTFWGTLKPEEPEKHPYMLGRGRLVESNIDIDFHGERFIDVLTYDLITEKELAWWPPPEIPGCHAIDDTYVSVSGRKLRFDSEGGIILN